MANNEQIIEQTLINITSETLPNVEEGDWQALQRTANAFLEQVYRMSQEAQQILDQPTVAKSLILYKAMRQVNGVAAQVVSLQHQFEMRVNDFLGRKIYLSYVSDDGSLTVMDELAIGELYKNATRGYGRGNISKSKIDTEREYDVDEELKAHLETSIAKRQQVYTTVLSMYEDPRNTNMFFWYHLNENHRRARQYSRPFPNKGPIAEGYVSAVLNDEQNLVTNTDATPARDYSALKYLYFNHIEMDNIPAVVKGDVVWSTDGTIQLAVKTGSFSTARFGQYIRLAVNITNIQQLTTEQFRQALPKLVQYSKIARQFVELAKINATDEIDRIASEVANHYKLNFVAI